MIVRKTSNFNLSELILIISIISMVATISATIILMVTTSLSRNDIEHETGKFIHSGLTELKEEIKNAKHVCSQDIIEIAKEKNIYPVVSNDNYFCNSLPDYLSEVQNFGSKWLFLKTHDDQEVVYIFENAKLFKEEPIGTKRVKIFDNIDISFKQRNNELETMKIEVDLMTTKKKNVFHSYDFYVNLHNDID